MSAHLFHKVRQPAFAGMFYPGNPIELASMVRGFISDASPVAIEAPAKAFVLPHAGYIFSGAVAGTGYRVMEQERAVIRRIILLGPSHRMAFRGLALSAANSFATPLGEVSVDETSMSKVLDLPGVKVLEEAHTREHGLEVHLPFLQTALNQFTVVPLVVGEASEKEVSAVLEALWGGAETRIVISSDLSHYHDHTTAQQLDQQTAEDILTLRPVQTSQACGAHALNGLLHSARTHSLRPRVLDLRNSGDTAGDKSRVVGYGAFTFERR